MIVQLSDIALIKAGHPFRGKIPEASDGDALAVQIRDVSGDGNIVWDQVIRTTIIGRKNPDWLRSGQILFAARGQRNKAALVEGIPSQAVCAPHFFIIEVKDRSVIVPSFLAWQLNQAELQRYFTTAAQGTSQVSVNRAQLEEARIAIPKIEQQSTVVKLYRAAQAEKKLHIAFIKNREKQLAAISHQIISDG
jgi:restriction endonuclease S subunit